MCLCLHLHERRPGRLPVLCIAELVQRLSFGLLIPFYSTGIMCYSNPNPIWGAWRWHEDDVTARTRGETENHRPTHRVTTLHERQITSGRMLERLYWKSSPTADHLCQGGKLTRVTASRELREKSILHWIKCISENLYGRFSGSIDTKPPTSLSHELRDHLNWF